MTMWGAGTIYESYVGRWSRPIARAFVHWLDAPPAGLWLDMGCGTGALTETVFALASPRRVISVDSSPGFVAHARAHLGDDRAAVVVGDAQNLPLAPAAFDVVVSGLMLNFLPEPERGVAEMVGRVHPGGVVAAYVWDYAGEMQLMRYFWDAAAERDPAARDLDEGQRFSLCHPDQLVRLFSEAGLTDVDVRAIDIPTVFRDFDDYWTPFLGGQGTAPRYAVSLDQRGRAQLRETLHARLPIAPDGTISLMARAWAVCGRVATP